MMIILLHWIHGGLIVHRYGTMTRCYPYRHVLHCCSNVILTTLRSNVLLMVVAARAYVHTREAASAAKKT